VSLLPRSLPVGRTSPWLPCALLLALVVAGLVLAGASSTARAADPGVGELWREYPLDEQAGRTDADGTVVPSEPSPDSTAVRVDRPAGVGAEAVVLLALAVSGVVAGVLVVGLRRRRREAAYPVSRIRITSEPPRAASRKDAPVARTTPRRFAPSAKREPPRKTGGIQSGPGRVGTNDARDPEREYGEGRRPTDG
jgi:hypothetical protein